MGRGVAARCVAKGWLSVRWQDEVCLKVDEKDPQNWQRQEDRDTGGYDQSDRKLGFQGQTT